jgi:hypothetical protein
MLPCSEQREQILRELVQELMHQVLPKLELVLQPIEPESQESYRVCEQQVVIALVLVLVLQVPQPGQLLQEQRELLVQELNLVPKYLEELQALVLGEFHL